VGSLTSKWFSFQGVMFFLIKQVKRDKIATKSQILGLDRLKKRDRRLENC